MLTGIDFFCEPFRQKPKNLDDISASSNQADIVAVEEAAAHSVLYSRSWVSLTADRKHFHTNAFRFTFEVMEGTSHEYFS